MACILITGDSLDTEAWDLGGNVVVIAGLHVGGGGCAGVPVRAPVVVQTHMQVRRGVDL